MKNTFFLAILSVALLGCADAPKEEKHEEHAHLHSYTAYTADNEFFMQHSGLEAGKEVCMTLYVTALENFKPSVAATATATLKVGGKEQAVTAAANSAGMFHFNFAPEHEGEGHLAFEAGGDKAHFHVHVLAKGEKHDHAHSHAHNHDANAHEHGHSHAEHAHNHDAGCNSHGDEAHAHQHAAHSHAHAGHGEETAGKPGDIAFGKEQSWKVDFATGVAELSHFGGAVKVAAKVVPAPDNFTTVVAAASGKVQFVGNIVEGKKVEKGDVLFCLDGGNVTDNDAAVKFAEAESSYNVAKADYERKKILFDDKVVSEREYQVAEAAFKQAESRYESMKRSFAGGKVTLCAMRSGFVETLLVANGDYVQPGTPLATIQSAGAVNITAELPVRYAGQLNSIKDVNVELPSGSAFSMNGNGGSVLAVGGATNSCNMLPLTISAGEVDGLVPGSIVTLYIISEGHEPVVTVPRTALVEEMGNFFLFVQSNPVSFEKRSVVTGASDGVNIEIVKGLHAGERVVTEGALLLKLSQGAAALDPHAGHVH